MTSAWEQADKAYQAHHTLCPQCIAAGTTPGRQQRCPEGQSLWDAYLAAGDPPHFLWVKETLKPLKTNSSNRFKDKRQQQFY